MKNILKFKKEQNKKMQKYNGEMKQRLETIANLVVLVHQKVRPQLKKVCQNDFQ